MSSPAEDVAIAGRGDLLGGLVKGLAIIELFNQGQSRLTVANAARETGITRAAARRCLLTLVDLGYLAHDGKFFSPEQRLRRLGQVPNGGSLLDRAQPHLDALRDQLGESISLAVLDGTDSLFVARAEADRIIATGVKVGRRLPAYCSATGRVLLSGLQDEEVRAVLAGSERPQRTIHTLTDEDSILDAIRVVRRDGYSVSDEELELGMRSMAVVVRGARGNVAAALSMSASAPRVSLQSMRDDILPVLQKHAALLGGSD